MTTPDLAAAVAPVAQALLAAARADAAGVLAAAETTAAARLAEAQAEADRIRAEAWAQGAASGTAAAAVRRTRARRAARTGVLRAQRDAYLRLRSAGRAAVARLPADPDWPRLHAALTASVSRRLGPGATVRDLPGGGVVGEADGRRVDCSLAVLADRATDTVARHLEGLSP